MTESPTAATMPVLLDASALPGFTTGLFVQGYCHEVYPASDLVRTCQVGIVYTPTYHQRRRARMHVGFAVQITRTRAGTDNVLVDAGLYGGKRRKPAAAGVDASWITFQRGLGLPWAMTDSGYCAAGDTAGVRKLLDSAAGLGNRVITALPVAAEWLVDDAARLRELIDEQPNPVALMVEAEQDPFDRRGVVAGLVHIIGADRPVLLLRSDTAALGALAHGAAAGAVGAHSALRHIYPVGTGGGAVEHLSFVIPELLGYYLDSRFRLAYFEAPDLPQWACGCTYCAEQLNLTWIANSAQPFAAAFQHSVAAIAGLGSQLMTMSGLVSPVAAWTQLCGLAQVAHDAATNPSGSAWEPKKALKHWRAVTPTTVGR